MNKRKRLIIRGAAGRDYHNFNQVYRDDPAAEVVAGTPIDVAAAVGLSKPVVRIRYRYQDHGSPGLMAHIDEFLAGKH